MLKAHRIQAEIDNLKGQLAVHQARCKHKKVEETRGSDTGNYDRSVDSYWIDFKCPTCLARWTEYQ